MRRGFASPSFHNRAHQLAIATIAVSIIQGFLLQSGLYAFLFSPFKTLYYFELWRPFTSLFVAASPVEVIFGALIIYSIGGMLESRWSRRRFTYATLGIPLAAEVVVLALSFIAPSLVPSAIVYAGSRQVITTLWILYGLAAHFSRERLNFWGTPITGKTFALIGVGFVFLSGVFGGFIPVLPDVITVALTFWAFTGGAHGYGSTSCTLVDLRTGKSVMPEGVFAPGSPWLKEVVAIVGADLKKQFVDNPGFEDALQPGKLTKTVNTGGHFCWQADKLQIYFNQYEVGPYSSGPYTVDIPYSRLKPLLRAGGPISR